MSSDTSDAVAQLVDHLVTTGRQNIGVLAGPQYAGTAHQRLEAIRGALARHGLDLPAERVCHQQQSQLGKVLCHTAQIGRCATSPV